MNEQHEASQAIPREHFFHVSIAKHLFYHPSYGIVTANEPIRLKDAAHYGLSPLILYGLSVPGTIVQWLNFARVEQPLPLLTVLGEAWLIADGLRGHPDILRVNKHLAQSSPDLAAQLARIGVELKVTEPGDRALSGGLRSVQHSTLWLLPGYEKRGPDIEDPLLVLRRVAFQRHLRPSGCCSRVAISTARRRADRTRGRRACLAPPVRAAAFQGRPRGRGSDRPTPCPGEPSRR